MSDPPLILDVGVILIGAADDQPAGALREGVRDPEQEVGSRISCAERTLAVISETPRCYFRQMGSKRRNGGSRSPPSSRACHDLGKVVGKLAGLVFAGLRTIGREAERKDIRTIDVHKRKALAGSNLGNDVETERRRSDHVLRLGSNEVEARIANAELIESGTVERVRPVSNKLLVMALRNIAESRKMVEPPGRGSGSTVGLVCRNTVPHKVSFGLNVWSTRTIS